MNKSLIKDYIIITLGTIIVGAAVFLFLVPSQVAIGSISGCSVLLSNVLPLSVSVIAFILNAIILVFGFLLIGKEFGFKTVYASLLLPVVIGIFERLFPNFQSLTNDQFLDVLCYCFVVNIGVAILFSINASSGGIDVIAKIMNKYLHMDLGKAGGLAGMVIALSSFFVYDTKTVVLSVLSTYLCGEILDHYLFGSNVRNKVCILSDKHEEILHFILHDLHSGATKYQAYGAYSDEQRIEINTIVNKTEYIQLLDYIKKTDPKAFVTVYTVKDSMIQPKN